MTRGILILLAVLTGCRRDVPIDDGAQGVPGLPVR